MICCFLLGEKMSRDRLIIMVIITVTGQSTVGRESWSCQPIVDTSDHGVMCCCWRTMVGDQCGGEGP